MLAKIELWGPNLPPIPGKEQIDTMNTATSLRLIRTTRIEESHHVVPAAPMIGILLGSVIGSFLWGGIILALEAIFKY
jgi:hypothetical protein